MFTKIYGCLKLYFKMSHISRFHEEARHQTILATPNPRVLGRSVRDFYSERDAVATPKRYASVATPLARRVQYHPDLVAELEEEGNKNRLKGNFYIYFMYQLTVAFNRICHIPK